MSVKVNGNDTNRDRKQAARSKPIHSYTQIETASLTTTTTKKSTRRNPMMSGLFALTAMFSSSTGKNTARNGSFGNGNSYYHDDDDVVDDHNDRRTRTSSPTVLYGLNFVRPGVITGRRNLQRLEEYISTGKMGYTIPVVRCCSQAEVDTAISQYAAAWKSTAGETQGQPSSLSKHNTPISYPILIVRLNFGTSLRYARSVCGKTQLDSSSSLPSLFLQEKKNSRTVEGRGETEEETEEAAAVRGAIELAMYLQSDTASPAVRHGVAIILQTETLCLHQLTSFYEQGILPACRVHLDQHKNKNHSDQNSSSSSSSSISSISKSKMDSGLRWSLPWRRQLQCQPLFSSHVLALPQSECHSYEELNAIGKQYEEEIKALDMKLNIVMDVTR